MKHLEINSLLPEVFQRTDQSGSLLYGFLEAMESLTEPAEKILQHIHLYFNLYSTPDVFLPYFAKWVDLDRLFPSVNSHTLTSTHGFIDIDSLRIRELILAATILSKLRGTSEGLKRFLNIATGVNDFDIDENLLPFHIKVIAPRTAFEHRLLIERIIEQEKPAYVTYALEFSHPEGESSHDKNS